MFALFRQFYNKNFSPDKTFVNKLRTVIGTTPIHLNIYRTAFTHSSMHSEVGRNNERLELLGDSVFDLVVSEYLYKRYPYRDEGFLSEMRSKIVSRKQSNILARKLGIDQFLESNLSEDRLKRSSSLGNAFEALLGALYLDMGYKKTRKIIYKKILLIHFNLNELEETMVNFKSAIIQFCQQRNLPFEFKTSEEQMGKNRKKFTSELYIEGKLKGKASRHNKKQAEQAAAQIAAIELGLTSP